MENENYIYVVISQTGTILSRILKIVTKSEYNHASISLSPDLHTMYSFGRKHPYNPFFGGFVKESAEYGTLKRFSQTKIIVLKTPLTNTEYEKLSRLIDFMSKNQKSYKYNYLGLLLAALKIHLRLNRSYYCSEFVRDILVKYKVKGAEGLNEIIHPMDFLQLPDYEIIYKGKLHSYKQKNC